MKKPIRKDYCTQTAMTAMMNATEGKEKYVHFDSKTYAKDAEKYIEHLENIMRLTSANLRDVAVTMGQTHKDYNAVCQLAERLYNSTL